MKKKLIMSLGLLAIIASSVSIGAYGATNLEEIKVILNKSVNLKLKGETWQATDSNGNIAYPLTYKGTTYLPVKSIGDALDVKVGWDAQSNSVLIGETEVIQTVGSSRSNPAPIGTRVTFENTTNSDKFNVVLSIDGVLRGEEAWKIISKENQFNESPKEGYEFILVSISATIISNSNKEATAYINDYDFVLVSSAGKDYDHGPIIVIPKPQLTSNLYIGASNTGYAVFHVKKEDPIPLITYGRKYDGTGGAWFKINP